MNSIISTPIRYSLLLIFSALLVTGCSSSSDSNSSVSQSPAQMTGTDGNADDDNADDDNAADGNTDDGNTSGANTIEDVGTTTDASGSEELSTTRVNFDITVPVYVSNSLQVQIVWGDIDTTAMWNSDELWTASIDFPTNTENQLIVTFNDDNGVVTLASFEESFRTGTNPSESFQITANEFNSARWDSDNDGISNLEEALAENSTQSDLLSGVVEANLELVADKTFRFSWQSSTGAEFYRVLENTDAVSGYLVVSENLSATTVQYDHRVALHRRLNASYIVQACNEQFCVDSQEFFVPNSIAQAVGYFKANDAEENDAFGVRVVLSADGNTMAVTRLGDSDFASSRGEKVYVYSRVDGTWEQQAILGSSHRNAGDTNFGLALSLSANGDLLIVGSSGEFLFDDVDDPESNFERDAGAVYVFQRESGNWLEQSRLVSNSTSGSSKLGHSVSISNDGSTIAAGAPSDRSDATCCGSVIIFEFTDGSWQQQNRIFADTVNTTVDFGSSVSLSEDGATLAVGDSTQRILGDTPVHRVGAAYVFSRNDMGWEQQAFLRADDPVEGAFFGESVSLDADGDVLAVGAPLWNFGRGESGPPIGAAYVFRLSAGTWRQEARLNTTFQGDFTGEYVELTGDGSTLVVNSNGEDFVTIYKHDGLNWLQQLRFNGQITQTQNEAPTALDSRNRPLVSSPVSFASSISISSDGETLAIGALADDSGAREINGDRNDRSLQNSGAVFLF